MTKTYLKNKVNRGIFLTLSTISILFSNHAFAEQGGKCKVIWSSHCSGRCEAPSGEQFCILNGGKYNDCESNVGCAPKVECTEGQYCVRKAWEVGYNIEGVRQGNRWVCVECADIPRDTPLVLKQGAIKLEKVEFGQAVIDPNLIEY